MHQDILIESYARTTMGAFQGNLSPDAKARILEERHNHRRAWPRHAQTAPKQGRS
jgi:hypothetical protein